MSEKAFEQSLLKQIKENHGTKAHAFKVATQFKKGVLDVYTKLPDFPTLWVELKFKKVGPNTTSVKIELTELQRNFMRKEQKAGGNAGWMLYIVDSRGNSYIVASSDPDAERISFKMTNQMVSEGKGYQRSKETWEQLFKACLCSTTGIITEKTKCP